MRLGESEVFRRKRQHTVVNEMRFDGITLISNTPIFVGKRRRIQFVSDQPPLRHFLIQQRHEPIRMVPLKEMSQLMHDNVLKALLRFLHQFEVQPNPLRLDTTGAPLSLHPLDPPLGKVDVADAKDRCASRRRRACAMGCRSTN